MKKAIMTMAALAIGISWADAQAQSYPSKPVRLIVPFAPGGGTDIFARQVAAGMSEILKQQVVVDNRGGAGGKIGMDLAASAPADGYTLVMGHTGTLAVNPTVLAKINYDPLRQLEPISLVAKSPVLMAIHPSIPARTVEQFVKLAKAKPGVLSYGSGGVGGANHLATEYFKYLTGTNIVHVPYRSAGLAAIDAVAGQIALVMPGAAAALPHVRAGKLRALGISSDLRLAIAPEIPTIAESGVPEFKVAQWYGILAPATTSPEIVRLVSAAIHQALSTEDLKKSLTQQAADPAPTSPAGFRQFISKELVRWRPIIVAAGLQQ